MVRVAQGRADSLLAKPAVCGQRAFAPVPATGRSANWSGGALPAIVYLESFIGMQAGRLRYKIASSAPPYRGLSASCRNPSFVLRSVTLRKLTLRFL